MTRRSLPALFAVLALSAAAWAGPMRREVVASGAKWVVHVDVEGLIASDVGQAALALIREMAPALDARLAAFSRRLGPDPLQDVSGITLYGSAFDGNDGVAVIRAGLNKGKLLGLLGGSESHKEIAIGQREAYQWVEPRRGGGGEAVRVGAFHGDDTVVIARSAGALERALEVLDGNRPCLAKVSPLLPDSAKPVFFWAAVVDLPAPAASQAASAAGAAEGGVGGNLPSAEFIKWIRDASIYVGCDQRQVFGKVALTARTEENGIRIRQMLQGLLTFAQIAADARASNPLAQRAGELLDAVAISGEGVKAAAEFSFPLKDLQTLARKAVRGGSGSSHGPASRP